MIFVAPNDVIWMQELNLRILRKHNFDCGVAPANSVFNSSGDEFNVGSTTFPDVHQKPADSPLYLNAWLSWHSLSIAPITICESDE